MDVGAGDVKFDGRNTVECGNAAGAFGIVLGRRTAHVHNGVRTNVGELGIDVFGKIVDSFVLQADAVEHARCGFRHARIVIAFAREEGGAFHDESAESIEIDKVGKFHSVAESAGSGHHRIL